MAFYLPTLYSEIQTVLSLKLQYLSSQSENTSVSNNFTAVCIREDIFSQRVFEAGPEQDEHLYLKSAEIENKEI